MITTVAGGAVRLVAGTVGSAIGLVKNTISGHAPSRAEAATSSGWARPGGDDGATAAGTGSGPGSREAGTDDTEPAREGADPQPEPVNPEPVNVVEELGLDPAPVDEPEPDNSIDAAADPDSVDATPADIAKVVEKDHDKS